MERRGYHHDILKKSSCLAEPGMATGVDNYHKLTVWFVPGLETAASQTSILAG